MSHALDVAERIHSSPADGAAIPEELFEDIVRHAMANAGSFSVPSREPPIQSLTALALVSRYFASFCRPWLYHEISLRNRRQLERLFKLFDNGSTLFGAPILAFTNHLWIWTEGDDTSWVHRVATALLPRLDRAGIKSIQDVQLTVSQALPGLASALDRLPRSLPSSLFDHINSLELQGMHFKHGGDLLRCLSSFRHLQCASLKAVTCKTIATRVDLSRFLLSATLHSMTVKADCACAETTLLALLGVYARRSPSVSLPRDHEEFEALVDIVRLSRSVFSPLAYQNLYQVDLDRDNFHLFAKVDPDSDDPLRGNVIERIRLQPSNKRKSIGDARYDCVICISVIPTDGESVDTAMILKVWHELSESVFRLQHLDKLWLAFDTLEHMEAFVKITHTPLQEMNAGGQRMEFGYQGADMKTAWETGSVILGRLVPTTAVESSVGEPVTEIGDGSENETNILGAMIVLGATT